MPAFLTPKRSPKQWLYFSASGITIFTISTLSNSQSTLSVLAYVTAENPILNAQTLANQIRRHVKGKVNLLLSDSLYQLLLSDVPEVPEDEIESAIELKATDLLSYDIDDAALDVIRLPEQAYRGRMKMAFIVASRKEPLRQWAMALIKVGIRVQQIDIEHTQLRNLGNAVKNYNESGLFYVEANRSRLLLTFNDELVLSRTFDIGWSSLINEKTLADGELELTVTDENQTNIQLESLSLEMRRSFDYYESQLGLGAVSEVHLMCPADYQHLAEQLTRKLGIRFINLPLNDLTRVQTNGHIEALPSNALLGPALQGIM